MTSRRIDDCLSTRDGRLYIEACDTLDLLREFGSPLFIFSKDQLRRNVRRFSAAFQTGWPVMVSSQGSTVLMGNHQKQEFQK